MDSRADTLSIICFTHAGAATAGKISSALDGEWAARVTLGFGDAKPSLKDWTESSFRESRALVFVGAAGIAVRAIAPFVASKGSDPAVVAVDERGQWAIPLLSGHLGGANALALQIASAIGAKPVITTATDVNGLWAVDTWAKSQGLLVREIDRIKLVSGKLLRGEDVLVASEHPIAGGTPRSVSRTESRDEADVVISPRLDLGADSMQTLHLVPKGLVAGIGCRKGADLTAIQEAFSLALANLKLDPLSLTEVHSIDVKAEEAGLLAFCERMGLPLQTHSAEELSLVPGDFTASEFVKDTVGVDNVCERSALLGAIRLCERVWAAGSGAMIEAEETAASKGFSAHATPNPSAMPDSAEREAGSAEDCPAYPEAVSLIHSKFARNGVTIALAYVCPPLTW